MEPMYILPIVITVILVAFLFFQNFSKTIRAKDRLAESLENQVQTLKTELLQERDLLANAREERSYLEKVNSSLQSDLKHSQERLQDLVNNQEQNLHRFENLASRILDEKTHRFDQQHKKGLTEILDPLKEKIQHFEQKVEHSIKEGISQHSRLQSQISILRELHQQMTAETKNLTSALKGDNKIQGNWGEIILESILEKSGLEKGREYFVQPSFKDEDGVIKRPDVVIHLPKDKRLIIDSKVSLKAYDRYVASETKDEQDIALIALSLSIKNHIDSLSNKNYHQIYDIASPDFVLMFIPIDSAFTSALHKNSDLYNYAFHKNVVIVTSSTLLATLKTVDSMWQNEKQQKYALEIANEAGKMYDKFVNFTEDMTKIGDRLDMTKNIFNNSMKKLKFGKGSLVSRAEKLKSLGAKASKRLQLKE